MDQPQRANAAQMAARNIKMAKGKHPRRPGLAQKDNSSTQSWATPSSETGLFGGNIQAAGTFNFASPGAFKFDTPSFGTTPNQKIDGLQSNIGGGFNQNNQSATTLFGAGAAPANQSASQTSSGFPAGQMMPSFGSGEMGKAPQNPGFSFQGGFQAGSFGGTTSVSAPVAPISHTAPTTATNNNTNITAAAAAAASTSTSTSTNSASASASASAPIFSFGSTSQPAAKPNSIFGSSGGITFDVNKQTSSQGSSQGSLQTASNSIFGFQTQASQNQPLTAEKNSGAQGFGLLQNPSGSSGVLGPKTASVESTNTLFGRQGSQAMGNVSNLNNLGTTSANSTNLFGAPQGTPTQGSNFKQNLFGPGLASNTCMMAPKSDETWGKASPASTNATPSTFSIFGKDEKLQKTSLSNNILPLKDNEQNSGPKNNLFVSSTQPTSATNLFGQQTSTSNMFSLKRDSSTLPKKSSPLKTFCEATRPDSPEPKMDTSNHIKAQSFNWPTSNTVASSNFASVHSDLSVPIKSNFFGSVNNVPNNQIGLSQSIAVPQPQLIAQSDNSEVSGQNVTSSGVNLIATENKKSKDSNEFAVGSSNVSTIQSGLPANINEKHSSSFLNSLTAKPVSNAEIKLSSNIFGQVNLSSLSSKSTNESPTQSTQTSFLSQNPKDATSSEVRCVSENKNTTAPTTETGSSKALSKIGSSQDSKTRNKYAPKVLPRNPLFRNLALTSQIKDNEIAASLPAGCGEIEREQYCALYRLRALNKAMGKMFSELPVTSDPQIVLDFYIEERRIILENCSSFGRKTKRKFSPEESEYNTTNKKRKQFELNISEQESKTAVLETSNFPRKRKLDDENQEAQTSEKRNKITQSKPAQGLINYPDGMLTTEKEDGSLFISKMTQSSLEPPIFTNKLETQTPSELMPSPAFSSVNFKTNVENSAHQKQQNNTFSNEENSYFKPNAPSASSNLKESSTANKIRSILDGPSHSNLFTQSFSSIFEKQDSVSNSNKLLQHTANNSEPLSLFLSGPTMSKSKNEEPLSGNAFSKVTADTNEETSQIGSENKLVEDNITRDVESQGYEKTKPKFAISSEEQTPGNYSPKMSQSFESAARVEGASLANPFSSIQTSIKETVNFGTASTKFNPLSSESKNDTDKNMRTTSTSTDNNKKRKATGQNSNSDCATVADTENESESEESEIDQKGEKEDPSYNPDLEINSAVNTPAEKTGEGLVASKRANFSPTINASFKTSSMPSETGILPGNNYEVKDLQKESGNEKKRQESKTGRGLLDSVSYLPDNSGQPTNDEKNIKTPGKKDSSGFQFQSFQENKSAQSDQIWKPGTPIVFATSTTPQPSPRSSTSIFNLTKTESTENSNKIPTYVGNNSEMKSTIEVDVTSKPLFSTLFGNPGTTKLDSTSSESVFGQNSGTGASSLFVNTTGSLSLFGNPGTARTSSFFPSSTNTLEASRTVSSGTEKIESDCQEEEDLGAQKDEQINLTSTGPGEENEEVLHEVRVKALQLVQIKDKPNKDWEVKGVGSLRILKHKANDNCRLLLRSDPSGKIILNRAILGNIDYKSTGKTLKFLSTSGTGKGLETWVLQVKTEQYATKLASVLEEYKPGP